MLNPLSGNVPAAFGNAAVQTPDPTSRKPAPAADGTPKDGQRPSHDALTQAVGKLNESKPFTDQGLRFSIDEESHKTVVKIVDTATQEILRQIPSEDALALAHSIDKMQGLLLREKA